MRIRIGNDIKLRLELNSKSSGQVNILSAQAYVVNKTAKAEALRMLRAKTRFLSRFPDGRDFIDPSLNGLEPTEYNINIAWDMPYHCYPHTHRMHYYNGFGVYPNWDKKFTPMVDNCDLTSYKAEVMFTENRGIIEIMFPAEAQLYTGDYDVIVVAKLYREGYKNNTITVTSDYQNAFTLIPMNETPDTDDSDVTIDYTVVNPEQDATSDDYVQSVNFDDGTNVLSLNRRNGASISTIIPNDVNWFE